MTNDAMLAVRSSHHQCLIGREVAMFRLIMLGLSPVNADRFLRCLPLRVTT